jgi:hypothetical protein
VTDLALSRIEILPGRYVIDFTVSIGDPVSEEKFRATIALQHKLSGREKPLSDDVQRDSATDKSATSAAD